MADFPLRCDRCHHYLSDASEPVRIVAIFRPSAVGVVPKTHPEEERHRCRSCGFVNVFHPLLAESKAS